MKNTFIFFLLNPFLGFIQGFKHYKQTWAINSVWVFVIFYGFTMSRPEEKDSSRYVTKLHELYAAPISWESFTNNFYSEEGNAIDVYQPLLTYLVSLVTDNGNILFALFGVVYGYFYSRNIWLLFGLLKDKYMDRNLWVLLIAFFCVIGFWELNGVRMWTAAHIFFYGVFTYIEKENKKGLLIAASSILVHFSFALPVSILLFFLVVKLPWKILYFIFIASFFISELNIGSIGEFFSNIAPEFLVPKIKSYTSDEYVEVVSEGSLGNWYIQYYTKMLGWFIFVMVSTIYFSSLSMLKADKKFSRFFIFTLLFLSVGNVMSLVPSGGRYLIIARLFAIALLFLFYVKYEVVIYKRWVTLLSPMLVFFIIVSIRASLETVTFVTVLANPILAVFIDAPIPIDTLIK